MIQSIAPCQGLSLEEARQFREQGFAGPFRALDEDLAEKAADYIDREVLCGPDQLSTAAEQSRHLDNRLVYEICSSPEIVNRMLSLYGPDLVLWRSNFFCKRPGGKEIPWHQDLNYWPLEPLVNITAWVALDDVDNENSCVNIIPGSHKRVLKHIHAKEEMQFNEMADVNGIDLSKAVSMHLKKGEFFLFNEKTLHQSNPNESTRRRMALAVRVTVPFVKVEHEKLFPEHVNLMLAGNNTYDINKFGKAPTRGPGLQDLH